MKYGKGTALLAMLMAQMSCTRAVPAKPVDLVVLCDVSQSLQPAEIESEADFMYRFISDDKLFPQGTAAIYIADRDVEQTKQQIPIEKKEALTVSEKEAQDKQLKDSQRKLKDALVSYCQRYPIRNKTCLVKAIRTAPLLFSSQPNGKSREIVILSDMLEDCQSEKDPTSAAQLRERLVQSLKEYPLNNLTGVQIIAIVVPSSESTMDVEVLREIWQETLKTVNAQITVGTIDELISNPPPLQ